MNNDQGYASLEKEPLVDGDDAARFLLEAMGCDTDKINRSYGCNIRGTDIVAQDEGTGAVCEVLTARLPQLTSSLQEWIASVETKLSTLTTGEIRVLGRLDMPQKKFNAEMDVSHVRVEYLLPADFLWTAETTTRHDFFQTLPNFCAGPQPHVERSSTNKPSSASLTYLYKLKKLMQLLTTRIVDLDTSDPAAVMEKEFHLQKRQRNRKKQQDEKRRNRDRRRNKNGDKKDDGDKQGHGNGNMIEEKSDSRTSSSVKHESLHENGDAAVDGKKKSANGSSAENSNTNKTASKDTANKTGSRILKRRRFHNFTPRVMAHEFLAYRRLDRFYHRATLRFDKERPFLALSLTGDLFLQGQAVRVIGLWVALARNLIDVDIVDCIFDEEYPHLIPTPPLPTFALYMGEASYTSWEGKSKLILSPRRTDRYPGGWNNDETIHAVAEWQTHMHETIAKAWMQQGLDEDGRLVAEREWTEQVLEPWVEQATEHLADYRVWKASQTADCGGGAPEAILPPLESVDATVPLLFEKVLNDLRKADASGLWPSTTPKRQLVMVSTSKTEIDTSKSLSAAHMRAKSNNTERASAYEFTEGQGGASGSFSVGAFPGEIHNQPKANALFPELMKHAFELEIALCPGREPSSTIAINRNAQFRPHTDSGAGAGQSTSLIVGLGTYVGGELVVEGEKKDIRYKGLEFNGWTQRHWTMPFQGERYSLVWFTPKGCEGVRGIDLCIDLS